MSDNFFPILVAIVSLVIFFFIVQLLWNNIMPSTFGVGELTFFQTIGLYLIIGALFGTSCGGAYCALGNNA